MKLTITIDKLENDGIFCFILQNKKTLLKSKNVCFVIDDFAIQSDLFQNLSVYDITSCSINIGKIDKTFGSNFSRIDYCNHCVYENYYELNITFNDETVLHITIISYNIFLECLGNFVFNDFFFFNLLDAMVANNRLYEDENYFNILFNSHAVTPINYKKSPKEVLYLIGLSFNSYNFMDEKNDLPTTRLFDPWNDFTDHFYIDLHNYLLKYYMSFVNLLENRHNNDKNFKDMIRLLHKLNFYDVKLLDSLMKKRYFCYEGKNNICI